MKNLKSLEVKKIIILSAVLEGNKEHNLHSNILLENDSSFEDYYEEISTELDNYNNLEYGYNNENIIRFVVKVWNCDNKNNLKIKMTHDATSVGTLFNNYRKRMGIYELHKRLYSTSNNKHWSIGEIKPLSLSKVNGDLKLEAPKPIFTMDLETINFNNTQTPIAISSCGQGFKNLFLIDRTLLQTDVDKALSKLWTQYFTHLESLIPSNLPSTLKVLHNSFKDTGNILNESFQTILPLDKLSVMVINDLASSIIVSILVGSK